jgi:lysophospholipase L1-like esterase
MKPACWAATALLLAGAAAAQPARPALLLVGDSTLAPQTGYGDGLCAQVSPTRACLNLGRGGRSTHSYRAEGLWDRVLARLRDGRADTPAAQPGLTHHVLIQFGHNDQPGKPGRSTDLTSEYPANLARFVDEVRAAGGVPVLMTPLTRRVFRDGQLQDDLAPWAEAMRTVARQRAVPLVDVHAATRAQVQTLGEAEADRLAMAPPGAEGFDRTHLGERGACLTAQTVVQALRSAVPVLAAGFEPGPDCMAIAAPTGPPAVPGLDAQSWRHPGWAVGTLGGRGGRVLRVSTLAASGPGSLKAALEARGPRQIVFEVGGVIDLAGASLVLREPFATLAGQTAPAPGITLIRGGLNIATHDVIVQHLRIRPGAWDRPARSGHDQDGLSTQGGAHHVIVDHCSFSWATDENLSIGGPRFDGPDPAAWRRSAGHAITFSHNLVYEGLRHSVHAKGEHSKGTLVHDNAMGVLLLGNVYAANRERNALFKGGVQAAMVNNLIDNPGPRAVHYNLLANEWGDHPHQTGQIALVGNVLRHGHDTPAGTPLFSLGGQGDVALHLHDNLAVDTQGRAVPQTGRYATGQAKWLTPTAPYLPPRLQALPAASLEDRLLAIAGARPWDRDAIDRQLVSDVAEARTRHVDSESASSGYPKHPATRRTFDPAAWDLDTLVPRAGWAALAQPASR